VGLEVHEGPTLSPRSSDTLAAGNVVSVEPGVYVPGRYGVRIEDLVVVTEDGCDVFSSLPKQLTVVT
jgi:Xaa-Pro aminopeptidase